MKRLVVWMVAGAAMLGAGATGYNRYYAKRNGDSPYQTQAVRRTDVKQIVNSTGTVQPVLSVQVGSFVSGPIQKIYVDFNTKVTKDQLMAEIDPRIYKALAAREEATLARAKADLARTRALVEQAIRNEKRGLQLRASSKGSISDTDLDQCVTERKSLEAQIKLAEAAIQESEANLANAKTNLDYTAIKSPVDGIVIDRKVDQGQTVASQFQTPVLFVVAPDLEKKVYVYASVDEADIGLIREAQKTSEPVTFTVDAYPKDTFEGKIFQVRLSPTTVQNVVTYTVVVEAPNGELKLLPGMTANLSFQIDKHTDVLAIPNAALRFYPKSEQVRPEDQAILEGTSADGQPGANGNSPAGVTATDDPSASPGSSSRRHVWLADGDLLKAVEIVTGLSDKNLTELVSGDLKESQPLVVGLKAVK